MGGCAVSSVPLYTKGSRTGTHNAYSSQICECARPDLPVNPSQVIDELHGSKAILDYVHLI